VEGTELLAHIIHPELFKWEGSQAAFRSIEFSTAAPKSFSIANL
jgi:hypothetical protein